MTRPTSPASRSRSTAACRDIRSPPVGPLDEDGRDCRRGGEMIAELKTVAFDARDIGAEADFYTALAGWSRAWTDDDWITMFTPDGWRIAFQLASDHVPPRWPAPAHPQQAHLDLRVPDIDAAAEKAVALGATLLRRAERWHTLADPAGHPFDLCLHEGDANTTVMGVM